MLLGESKVKITGDHCWKRNIYFIYLTWMAFSPQRDTFHHEDFFFLSSQFKWALMLGACVNILVLVDLLYSNFGCRSCCKPVPIPHWMWLGLVFPSIVLWSGKLKVHVELYLGGFDFSDRTEEIDYKLYLGNVSSSLPYICCSFISLVPIMFLQPSQTRDFRTPPFHR